MDEEWRMEDEEWKMKNERGVFGRGGAGTCVPAHRSPVSLQKLSVTLVPKSETDLSHHTGVFTK